MWIMMAICQAILLSHQITFSHLGRSDPAKQTEKGREGEMRESVPKVGDLGRTVVDHPTSTLRPSGSSSHARRIVAADAAPRAQLILSQSITVRVGETWSKTFGDDRR